MLRFYYKRYENGDYKIMSTDFPSNVGEWYPQQMINAVAPFVEIYFFPGRPDFIKIIPLDTLYINGAAIKAANDHNEVVNKNLNTKQFFKVNEIKYKVQDIIDMSLAYDDEFDTEFDKILLKLKERFPIPPITIPEGTIIIG